MANEKNEATIRVMLDLTPGGVKNVMVFSETSEDREQAWHFYSDACRNWNCSNRNCNVDQKPKAWRHDVQGVEEEFTGTRCEVR